MRTTLLSLVLAAGLCGCATHYSLSEPRGLLQAGLVTDPGQVSQLEKSLTDRDIATLLDADIRAKLPTKLAVARVGEGYGRCGWRSGGVGTLASEELQDWESVIRGLTAIAGVQPVPAVAVGESRDRLRDVRTAAARMGCELLLVYVWSESAVDNYNDAAALYWTFVGLWLAPGNVYEHRTLMQAVVLDTRTGAILGTATGDSHRKQACPAAYGEIQQAKLAEEAGREASAGFQQSCRALLKDVVASAQRGRP